MPYQQTLVPGLVWSSDLDLLREAPSAENRGIDAVQMIRGPDQKDIVLGIKFADQTAGLFDKLNVVLRLNSRISRQESVHFVDEDDGRAVFFGPGE